MWLLTNRKGGSADKIEPAACVFVRVCGAGNSIRGENEGFVLGMLCTSGPFSHLYAHVDTQRHTHTSHLTACYKGEDTHTCNCTHSFLEDGWKRKLVTHTQLEENVVACLAHFCFSSGWKMEG